MESKGGRNFEVFDENDSEIDIEDCGDNFDDLRSECSEGSEDLVPDSIRTASHKKGRGRYN